MTTAREVIHNILSPKKWISLSNLYVFSVFCDYEITLPSVDIPFEQEPYFRLVDRETAEEILKNRVDGSFLIRPYKEKV